MSGKRDEGMTGEAGAPQGEEGPSSEMSVLGEEDQLSSLELGEGEPGPGTPRGEGGQPSGVTTGAGDPAAEPLPASPGNLPIGIITETDADQTSDTTTPPTSQASGPGSRGEGGQPS